jgi:hypothetical protein
MSATKKNNKSEFNEITPVERPIIFTENIPDPN